MVFIGSKRGRTMVFEVIAGIHAGRGLDRNRVQWLSILTPRHTPRYEAGCQKLVPDEDLEKSFFGWCMDRR